VLAEARGLLSREHAIAHATLQVESAASRECHELDW
jgi:cobalt-zinc-cadmium efflux system protein